MLRGGYPWGGPPGRRVAASPKPFKLPPHRSVPVAVSSNLVMALLAVTAVVTVVGALVSVPLVVSVSVRLHVPRVRVVAVPVSGMVMPVHLVSRVVVKRSAMTGHRSVMHVARDIRIAVREPEHSHRRLNDDFPAHVRPTMRFRTVGQGDCHRGQSH